MLIRFDLILPLIVFCVAMFYTPGPNNLMLMTSTLNVGLRRTLPHLFGVVIGFSFLALCVGVGLGTLFSAYPMTYTILKYAGTAYLLYLAWLIATAPPPHPNMKSGKKPMTFAQAAAFQWINPKGCLTAVGAFATYSAIAASPYNIILIVGLFFVMSLGSAFGWAVLGAILQKFLHHPKWVRGFNIIMAILLVASLYPVFSEFLHS